MYSEAGIPAGDHPTPLDAPERGCGWPAASDVAVEPDWPSGYYEVILTIDVDGKARRTHAFFVVRPDLATTTARMLLALSTNTWHAYNDFGGRNLYTGATSVSMQRPMAPGYLYKPPGAGQRVTSLYPPDPQSASHVGYLRMNHLSPYGGSAGWPNWELPFVEWADREGYEIDVVTNADLEEHPELLGDGLAVRAVPVDRPRRVLVRPDARHRRGVHRPRRQRCVLLRQHLVLAGAPRGSHRRRTGRWAARAGATMVGYKGFFKRDPVYDTDRQAELTTIWSDHLLERPENHMTGVSFSRGGYHRIGKRVTNGAGGYTLHRAEHWIFDGTGLGYGDLLGARAAVVGYECDGCDFTYRDGLPYPTGEDGTPTNFEILGSAPAAHFTRTTASRPPAPNEPAEDEFIASRLFDTRDPAAVERISHGHAILGTYVSPGGGTVITSGSTDWVWGLAERDRHIEQITRNIFDRLS